MSDIVERLRSSCRDWDGSEQRDASEMLWLLDCGAVRKAADEIQSLRQRVERLEEHLRAISQSGIVRATKWAGMNAHDIARAALSPKVQEGDG